MGGWPGWLVVSEATERVEDTLDRRLVRERFEERFTARRMAEDYLRIYRSLAADMPVRKKLRVIG